MKIGFDISQTGSGKSGCGYFADSLIRQLAQTDQTNEYILYPTFGGFFWDDKWKNSIRKVNHPRFCQGRGHESYEESQQFWRTPPDDLEAWLGWPDIVHANNFYCPQRLTHAKLVYTLYDIAFVEQPNWTTEANRVGCFEGAFQASIHADFIVAISEFSRQHFLATFPYYPPERSSVIHLASRYANRLPVARPKRLAHLISNQFWLCVGTIEPRKNHLNILKAYRRLKQQNASTIPLVMAGGKGWLMHGFEAQIKEWGLQDDVVLLGYVDDQVLQWLYQNCFALIYPSLWEGFGLPVLEAMSQGAPVITSNSTSLSEVAGDAAILVDPLDDEEITRAMARLTSDNSFRRQIRERSLKRASEFSWRDSAQKLIQCYESVMVSSAEYRLSKAG